MPFDGAMVNWPQVIVDLQLAGLSPTSIGKACDRSAQTISGLAKGKPAEPRYPVGVALLWLWVTHAARVPDSSASSVALALRKLPLTAASEADRNSFTRLLLLGMRPDPD